MQHIVTRLSLAALCLVTLAAPAVHAVCSDGAANDGESTASRSKEGGRR